MLDSQFKRNPPKQKNQNNEPQTGKVLLSSRLHLRYYFKYSAVSLPLVKLPPSLPHDLHFSPLALPHLSHRRTQPARWKLGFSFPACLLASCRSGREREAVAVSGGNVTEFKSKLAVRHGAPGLAMAVSGGFSPRPPGICSLVSDAAPSRSEWQW